MSNTVWFVTSEAAPLAKTGGLADVCGSLPGALAELGTDPAILMPWYGSVTGSSVATLGVPLGERELEVRVGKTRIDRVPVYLIGHDPCFDRTGLYGDEDGGYEDNDRRFTLFSRAVLEWAKRQGPPDLYHCHDWFTGLVPALIRTQPDHEERPVVFTIHNLHHQGVFPADSLRYTGIPQSHFHPEELEFYGQLNFMKAGIVYADRITTVSPTYGREIQTEEAGEGLEGVLRSRGEALTGILNGIDTDRWNPKTDTFLRQDERYDVGDRGGKRILRGRLVSRCGLGGGESRPLIGFIGRMVPQKGADLILEAWDQLVDLPANWVVLGTGDPEIEQGFRRIESQHPDRVKTWIRFSERKAHRIEAGADMFCMPSRFEPCGLNQMYSMRYGTVPVVHRTGGLADTVVDPADSSGDSPTGFCFDTFSVEGLTSALTRATDAFRTDPSLWRQLQTNGMNRDWSWTSSARSYRHLYREILR